MKESQELDGFTPSGFFALRTPLLPFDELVAWTSQQQATATTEDSTQHEAPVARDLIRLRTYLRNVCTRPEVREALFVASSDLDERFDVWIREPESEAGQKMERALVRYFSRMAGRATPFGLFAGCSVGAIGPDTCLSLAERARYGKHTRLDMDYLVLLTDALAREPELRSALTFGVNSSLYPARGRLRYFEVRRDGKGWTHHQVALERSDYLDATLARADSGATRDALTALLLDLDEEAQRDEAEEYIGGLIDSQILVSELRPAVTGPEPTPGLAGSLRALNGQSSITPHSAAADVLEQVYQKLVSLDAGGLGAPPSRYRHIAELLKSLPGETELNRLFQVDMIKPVATATLGAEIVAEISSGVRLLHGLARPRRSDPLVRFRDAFLARYESREVSLVEALDEATGVGFDTLASGATDASSLLDGLTFPKPDEETVPWGKRESHLLTKLGEALGAGSGEIQLTPHDIEAMAEPKPPTLPDAFAVMASMAAASEAALANGEFQLLLEGVSGPSGARLLGRFCHGDAKLHQFVAQHVRAEEALHPEAVFAEIVHLPEGRLGNILARPILREYEIPYLSTASVPTDRQIPVTDLHVAIKGGQIILRSERLGRRVIPRLTSAHNFHASQGIYQFLCALQSQGTSGDFGWDWGPLREAPFLPRVVYGRLVLARAHWRAGKEELKRLGQTQGPARFNALQSWRVCRKLPRWIVLADADNELPIDLENVLAANTFIELVKSRQQITLIEMFPGPDQLCVRGPEGRFVHEIIVPFVRVKETRRQGEKAAVTQPVPTRSASVCPGLPVSSCGHSFPPGSEWLYAKLYTGPATVDQVLRDVVKPVVQKVMDSGAADGWFFIRYGDPDWHLRLRFHGLPARLHGDVLPALQVAAAPLLADGRLWRFQLDTYEREVERYGGAEGIVLAERFFRADSDAILAMAEFIGADTRGDLRWRLALLGMHQLLVDFGFDLATRRAVIHKTRDEFAAEFNTDTKFSHQLSAKFRPERRGVESLLNSAPHSDGPVAEVMEILRRRSAELVPVMTELRASAEDGTLSRPLTELAASYLHMHANRMLRSAHRAQELVLYDFLARSYESQAARTSGNRDGAKATKLASAIP
jgi:thiopeptide-type bacteriocin biosynthesis protein